MSTAATKSKVETLVLEWINQRDSGYRRDDMQGSPLEGKITCGKLCFVPNTGKMAVAIKDEKGNDTGRFKHVDIRYIKGCEEIEIQEQKKRGIDPSRIKTEDAICLEKGTGIIKNEGDVGFFKYMANVFYNADAPNRSKKAVALFRVVKKEEKVSEDNELDFARSEAVGLVKSMVSKTGNEYKYNETKIDNALDALGQFGGDTYAEKVGVLTSFAKAKPVLFLERITKVSDLLTTEISHALQLNVIQFAGSVVQYVEDNEVVAQLDSNLKKERAKIEGLAEMLKTPEYQSQYEKLKLRLEIAQENSLK